MLVYGKSLREEMRWGHHCHFDPQLKLQGPWLCCESYVAHLRNWNITERNKALF